MAEKQIPVHKKHARARARYGVLENLSKPYIQRKFRRLAGIGRLGTRRPLKRPSLIAAYVKRFKEYTRRHDRVDAPSKETSGEVAALAHRKRVQQVEGLQAHRNPLRQAGAKLSSLCLPRRGSCMVDLMSLDPR